MADGLRSGWEFRDKNNNTNEVTATLPARLLPSPGAGIAGANQPVKVISNISNGNYDVYAPGGPLQGDRIIFSRNASNNALIIRDQNLYNAYFNQNNPQGKSQFESLDKSIKLATFDNAQLLTGTDPVRNQNFENIKKSESYKSLSNSTPSGQRAPGAAPGSAGDGNNPDASSSGESPASPIDVETANEQLGKLRDLQAISYSGKNRPINGYPNDELLIYPQGMQKTNQDRIKFTMLRYSPRKITDLKKLGETGELGGRGDRQRGSSVFLPIQPSISDTNTVSWNSDGMSAAELIAASAALNTITEGPEGAANALQAVRDLIGGSAGNDIKTAVAAGFAGNAAGVKGLLTRVTGGIVNPNMELLFNGPQLRGFQFNFVMSARDDKEAKVIRNIIRFFKQGMSVKRSNTDLFLQSPNTFEIQYLKGNGEPQDWINQIKECALTGCSVNYTPAGNYATYADGAMTSYELALQFSELEPIYDDDYGVGGGKGNESKIGY